jgi:hypothetical protein
MEHTDTNGSHGAVGTHFVIPKTCKAGVVIEEGMNFKMGVEEVLVPEPGI